MKILNIFLFALLLLGCNAKHCIKVGGEYEGIAGNVEYCYDAEESKQIGVPVFEGPKQEENYLLSEAMIEAINKELDEVTTAAASIKKPIERLLERLHKGE